MAVNSTSTVAEVRTELNEVTSDVIPDTVIEQQLGHAEVIVGEYAADDADQAAIDMAVTIVAAYGTLTADHGGWQTKSSELSVSETFDVQGMVESLEARRAEALALVSPDAGRPSLHALGDRNPDVAN